ncbi:MAG: helix-turn-helix domain-containing protein [Alphaproteobacteria bacterium]|nr:helix-turn-helix domain-containing protein [Alphaproteobacteria bacterium]
MIDISQIKAARALLDWTQADLAETSGISQRAIAKIELGKGNPREDTLVALRGAFENNGINFIGTHGLEKKQERFNMTSFTGRDGMFKVWADIDKCFPRGGEIMLANLDDRLWDKHYRAELIAENKKRDKRGITFRGLLCEGDSHTLNKPEFYRTVSKDAFGDIQYYIYADRVCFMMFNQEPFRFILIQSAGLSDMFRAQFELNWARGKKIK